MLYKTMHNSGRHLVWRKQEKNKGVQNLMSDTTVNRKKNVLGIIAVVLSVLAFSGGIFIVPPYLFGIPSIILAICSIKEKHKKTLAIISLSLSIIAIAFSTAMLSYAFLHENESLNTEPTNASEKTSDQEQIKINTEDTPKNAADSRDFLSGYSWIMSDGSLLILNNDDTFIWWEDPKVKDDYFCSGHYEVLNGELAIEKIRNIESFDDGLFDRQKAVTKKDVFCLTLNNEVRMIDGKDELKDLNPKITYYYLAFPYGQTKEAAGINIQTQNEIYIKKSAD